MSATIKCHLPWSKALTFFHRIELGKSINTDEAAALGAVYQAAHLGKGFRVLTFGVKEANIYPILVSGHLD